MSYFLNTARLSLRPLAPGDLHHLVALDADPEVMRFLTGGKPTPPDEAAARLAAMRAPRGDLQTWAWAAEDRDSGEFLGWFSLRPDPERGPGVVELGYRLRRAAWGRSLASEGACALVEAGFDQLGVQVIFAQTMTVNLASRRVMEKAGLNHVRTFFADWPEVIAGTEHGDVEYALEGADWRRRGEAAALRALASRLPDAPCWLELRAGLLRGEGEVFGLSEQPTLSFVYRDSDAETLFVVGAPGETALAAALAPSVDAVLGLAEHAGWLSERLPGWTSERGMLHVLADPSRLPPSGEGDVRFFDLVGLGDVPLPDDLREELEMFPGGQAVSASFVDGQPVAFCYASCVTEGLWDVAIDTVPQHQRRGHAGRCAAHMIAHMQAQGRQPVWDAVEDNPASWKLARKLGFAAVDEIVIFSPPPAASDAIASP